MEILGLVFAGTATPHRVAMASFLSDVLGLARVEDPTAGPDMFALPDGSSVAVADEREEGGGTSRTIGLLVRDASQARDELAAAGLATGDVQANEEFRYVHFTAPDGELYELVERRAPRP